MEVPIITRHEVLCLKYGLPTILAKCRGCINYKYETVDGFVICNWEGKKREQNPKKAQ